VEAKPRAVENYITAADREPFEEWVQSLGVTVRSRIDIRIRRVEMGNLGDHRSVGDGVYELRFNFSCRVYYGEDGDTVILLTGGNKDTQQRDIARAKEYWRDYLA
jgi:putative addiction module killer protein